MGGIRSIHAPREHGRPIPPPPTRTARPPHGIGTRWTSSGGGGGGGSSSHGAAERILSRLPASLQKYARRLRNAPVSHVVAFVVLHELTAVVPLVGLFGLFHYCTGLVPLDYMMDRYGGSVTEGVARFERYFRRKGWFGFGGSAGEEEKEREVEDEEEGEREAVVRRWAGTDAKYKIVVEVALAYAITKALLPLRILTSLWATPWFAGVLVRLRGLAGRQR